MYERKETVVEENLDWEKNPEKIDNSATDSKTTKTKHIIHTTTEHNKIRFKKNVKLSDVDFKREITNLLAEYSEISLLLGLLVLPYIVGFIVVVFVLLYGAVPIDRFFSLKEGIFHFELWSIGSYTIITVGVIWTVIVFLKDR